MSDTIDIKTIEAGIYQKLVDAGCRTEEEMVEMLMKSFLLHECNSLGTNKVQ
jgi:hypothetical protein